MSGVRQAGAVEARSDSLDHRWVWVALLLAILAFVGPAVPATLDEHVLYIIPILLAGWIGSRQGILIVGIATTALLAYEFLDRHAAEGLGMSLVGLGMAGGGLWLAVLLVVSTSDHSLQEELEQRVAERTSQLRQVNQALEYSNEELQQFAYIASHDLQTPLRTISGFAQLLQRNYRDQLDQQAAEWLEYTVDGTQQMQTLISDLLAYSRLETRASQFEPTDLKEIFDGAVAMLGASIRESAARVTCSDSLPEVMGDHSQLLQLFVNLIGNGIKYRSEEEPRVHVSAEAASEVWTLSVRDNGIGIEEPYREKVFEIFKRLHNPQQYPGTGIGLAVCRRVVHRHGGRIWVESVEPHGAVFKFTIPRQASNPLRSDESLR